MVELAPGKDFEVPNEDPLIVRLGATWDKAGHPELEIDTACLILEEAGEVQEVVYHGFMQNRRRTVNSLIDPYTPVEAGAEGQNIEVNLGVQPENIKCMVFTMSAGVLTDLSTLEGDLTFCLKGESGAALASCSLPKMKKCTGMVRNCGLPTSRCPFRGQKGLRTAETKTVLVGAMFRDGAGWTFRYLLKPLTGPSPLTSWGEAVPAVKEAVAFLFPPKEGEEAAATPKPDEFIKVLRPCEDFPLDGLANLRFVAEPPAPEAPTEAAEGDAAAAEATPPPEPEKVEKLRIDVGFMVKAKFNEKEVEPLDIALVLYNQIGEEVAQVAGGASTDGVAMLGVEEPEEEEAEEEAEEEEEDPDNPKPKPPKVAKVFPPEGLVFPIKERIEIKLAEVSPDVTSIILFVNKYGAEEEVEEGQQPKGPFAKFESVRAKVSATFGGGEAEEEEEPEEGEEPKPKKEVKPDIPLGMVSVDCKRPEVLGKAGVILLKLYRDYSGSEYHRWRAAPAEQPDLELMRKQMSIPKPGNPDDNPELNLEEEETCDAWVARLGLEWRLRAINLFCGGESLEDLLTKQATAVATYDGKRDKEGLRHDKTSRSIYPTGDVYWGEYQATYRTGLGIYLFMGGSTYSGTMIEGSFDEGTLRHPDGSVYVGKHKGCLPEGEGTYTYANGEKYSGSWKAGKKHGKGVYNYSDGSVLHGEWKDGTLNGTIKWEHNVAFIAHGQYEDGVPAQWWKWEDKKTTLRQAGNYVTVPLTEEELAEVDEEEGPPKPKPPNWQGLSWQPDGMAYNGKGRNDEEHPTEIAMREKAIRDAEAKAKAEEEARLKAEADAKAAEEARIKAEEEAKAAAEAEAAEGGEEEAAE